MLSLLSLATSLVPLWESGMINFARGHPNSALLPVEETRCLLEKLSQAGDESNDVLLNALQYGSEKGSEGFREELKSFLKRHTGDDDFGEMSTQLQPCREDEANCLFVTNGVSHGLDLLFATQSRPGDVVLVERPSYFLVQGILKGHGLVIRGLPMLTETGGVDVDTLEEMFETGMMDVPRMIYIIPTHQNPTGHTMPIKDRVKLAALASRHGVLVVADEVYHLLDWRNVDVDGPRPARMASLSALMRASAAESPSGGCVSVSSFTKIFGPGIRCGWIECAPDIIDALVNHGCIQSQVRVLYAVFVFIYWKSNAISVKVSSLTQFSLAAGWLCSFCR
jgi:DNA-binding transcriptional MocR family regulator